MKQLFKLLVGGMIMMAMPLMMTSCEGEFDEIFGEWSRPTGTNNDKSDKPEPKSATISYATVNVGKTYGDAAFTNELTNTGDGTVTYSSSNTAVAEVNASTGLVTIKGDGKATITATVTDTENYTYATKTATYALGVGTAELTVSAEGFNNIYDGNAHGITVTAPKDATIKYGTAEGSYTLDASPTFTNASKNTVYYQVTKDKYTPFAGSADVIISKAEGTISFTTATVELMNTETTYTQTATLTGDGSISGYSSSVPGVATVDGDGKVTIVGAGTTIITATATDGTNYKYTSGSYTLTVKPGGLGKPSTYGSGTNPF